MRFLSEGFSPVSIELQKPFTFDYKIGFSRVCAGILFIIDGLNHRGHQEGVRLPILNPVNKAGAGLVPAPAEVRINRRNVAAILKKLFQLLCLFTSAENDRGSVPPIYSFT